MTHEFCDHCPGCRPALIDTTTGRPFADDSPLMVEVNRIWKWETTYAQRRAFIMITVHNSRAPNDLKLAQNIVDKILLAKP